MRLPRLKNLIEIEREAFSTVLLVGFSAFKLATLGVAFHIPLGMLLMLL
jgi:hypothetical protein